MRKFAEQLGFPEAPVLLPDGEFLFVEMDKAKGWVIRFGRDGRTIYGVGNENEVALTEKLQTETDPTTGARIYTPLVAIGLMVFYVFALMCISTVAVTVREAGGGALGWKWATIQFV